MLLGFGCILQCLHNKFAFCYCYFSLIDCKMRPLIGFNVLFLLAGFAIIKELTLEVENTVAKPKPLPVRTDRTSAAEVSTVPSSPSNERTKTGKHDAPTVSTSSNDENNAEAEKPSSTEDRATEESTYAHSEDGSARSPHVSPRRSTLENSSPDFHSKQFGTHDLSPHAKESQRYACFMHIAQLSANRYPYNRKLTRFHLILSCERSYFAKKNLLNLAVLWLYILPLTLDEIPCWHSSSFLFSGLSFGPRKFTGCFLVHEIILLGISLTSNW